MTTGKRVTRPNSNRWRLSILKLSRSPPRPSRSGHPDTDWESFTRDTWASQTQAFKTGNIRSTSAATNLTPRGWPRYFGLSSLGTANASRFTATRGTRAIGDWDPNALMAHTRSTRFPPRCGMNFDAGVVRRHCMVGYRRVKTLVNDPPGVPRPFLLHGRRILAATSTC